MANRKKKEVDNNMFGLWFCITIAIICFTILAAMYLYFCSENEQGIFEYNYNYEKRIKNLEDKISKLESERNN